MHHRRFVCASTSADNHVLLMTIVISDGRAGDWRFGAGAPEIEPAASCVTGRHLSRAVNNLLIWAHEFSSESPQKLHSVFAGES
ncbi:MAG TPA: hypothetical protein VKB49_18200, partial [Candidatus Sulfotelmatobacter sp.]|nr:hypothetical protein [Candidatus Sulfotelmatobacter sp.]